MYISPHFSFCQAFYKYFQTNHQFNFILLENITKKLLQNEKITLVLIFF